MHLVLSSPSFHIHDTSYTSTCTSSKSLFSFTDIVPSLSFGVSVSWTSPFRRATFMSNPNWSRQKLIFSANQLPAPCRFMMETSGIWLRFGQIFGIFGFTSLNNQDSSFIRCFCVYSSLFSPSDNIQPLRHSPISRVMFPLLFHHLSFCTPPISNHWAKWILPKNPSTPSVSCSEKSFEAPSIYRTESKLWGLVS